MNDAYIIVLSLIQDKAKAVRSESKKQGSEEGETKVSEVTSQQQEASEALIADDVKGQF